MYLIISVISLDNVNSWKKKKIKRFSIRLFIIQ